MNVVLASVLRRTATILLPLTLAWLTSSPVVAQQLREGDSVWEASTRGLGECPAPGAPLKISRLIGCKFYASSLEAFLADPVAVTAPRTIVYVHGNWMEYDNARERGLTLYRMLCQQTSDPIRMILFSWPSEREGRVAPDVREKAALTQIESYFLADFLKNAPQDKPLGLLGFSFGGAVISGTLQLFAGGSLDGRTLPEPRPCFPSTRVSLTAPAFDRAQFSSTGKFALALNNVERLVNLYNSQDPVLKRFRFLDRGAPVAAGFLGIELRSGGPLNSDPRIVQYDCSRAAGRTHSELDYYKECSAFKHSLQNILGH
jgi:hypothetical protein